MRKRRLTAALLVLCKDLSRFFRNYVEIGDYLERVFPALGVRLIAVNDGYDSDDYKGTTGGLDVVMKCIIYAAYSRDLSRKIKAAFKTKVRKGQYIGSLAPYGYLKDPADKLHLIPDPAAADVVRRIFALAIEGKTTGEIARILNSCHVETPAAHHRRLYPDSGRFAETTGLYSSWTTAKVAKILRREEYTGAIVSGRVAYAGMDRVQSHGNPRSEWTIIPGCHEAIISEEEFREAQKAIQARPNRTVGENIYLLRSLLHCGCCGLSMRRETGHAGAYYTCRNSFDESLRCPHGEHFMEKQLEELVIFSLSQLLQVTVDKEKQVREAAAKMKGTAENLRRSIEKSEQNLRKLSLEKMQAYESYVDGQISREAFQADRLRVLSETETLQKQADSLRQELCLLEQSSSPESSRAAEEAESFLKAENITNEMLLHFIERVDVYTGMRIQITYRFRNPFEPAAALPEEAD